MIRKCLPCVGLLAVCFFMLTSCAPTPPKPMQVLSCSDEDHCRVKVYVACAFHLWPCQISVDQDRVNANGNNVFWDLEDEPDGKRFKFDSIAGIQFKKAGNGFTCMPAGNRSFKCNNGKVAGEHEYGIKVVGDVYVPPLDPWIVN